MAGGCCPASGISWSPTQMSSRTGGDRQYCRLPERLHPYPDLALKLAALVDTSSRVAATRSRRDKIVLLAELFTRVPPDEIELAASYLGGVVRQEKLGLGWA